ncbi:hypothetical protein [Streptomyces sp. NPDC017448]|uniref:hypothetical protein n=1 Tax=Streptomyces sp. NPDC017448 TaxID=3364996 RepID=UPI00378D7DF8
MAYPAWSQQLARGTLERLPLRLHGGAGDRGRTGAGRRRAAAAEPSLLAQAHAEAIEAWIKGPPPASNGDVKSFYDTVPSGETSGRSVSKQPVDPNDPLSGYKQGGLNAKAYDVSGVDTRIRYDSSRNPPFTVMTSMPSKS